MYSRKVLDHFHNPRQVGEIANPSAIIEATNPACGDVLKLWLKFEGATIAEAKFKAQGCVPAVACGSWLAEWLTGREIARLRVLSAAEIEAHLDGLPVASHHAAVLAADCLRRVLEKSAGERPLLREQGQ